MPPMFPTAVAMAFELAAYGLLTGEVYKRTRSLYPALTIAMVGGRIVWGAASFVIYGLSGSAFSWQMFTAGAFIQCLAWDHFPAHCHSPDCSGLAEGGSDHKGGKKRALKRQVTGQKSHSSA